MRLSLLFAWRYLFGKKSTNAINIITGISIVGIGVGTAALIIVLSVFNGFEDLLAGLMNSVNADLKVLPLRGKTFEIDSATLKRISNLDGVVSVSLTLEEKALIEYEGNQDFCTLKGVDLNYASTTTIDSSIIQGSFRLREAGVDYLVLGGGIANRLNINIRNVFEPVTVYMPKTKTRSPMESPFRKRVAYPTAKFSIKQDYDYTYVFCSLQFAREILGVPSRVSAIEINTTPDQPGANFIERVSEIVGDELVVKDRYRQNDALFKLMKMEKWLSFAIAGLTLFIVSFNLIGALWMIVLDKKRDISILKAMGTTSRQIYNIILYEGLLVSLVGSGAGVLLALILYFLKRQFGLIGFPDGFVVDAYPIELRIFDFIIVGFTVLGIGLIASILPAKRGAMISAFVREE
jgi:lipoprotein-releasing system permease protein